MDPRQAGPGNGVEGTPGPGMGDRVGDLGESAQRLIDNARGTFDELNQAIDLKGRVDRHPYGMVAAAFGIGYVLGGGLFTPFTARVLRLGMKLAALPLVKDELLGMAEQAVDELISRTTAAPSGAPTGPSGGPGPTTQS